VASFVACALVSGTSTAAAAPTTVSVRIEGRTQTLFEGPILTEGHAVRSFKGDGGSEAEDLAEHACDGTNNGRNAVPGATPTAASVDAMELGGETRAMAGQWYPGFDDYLVKQWGSEDQNAEAGGRSWGLLVNNVYAGVGGCQYELGPDNEVLWIYNAFVSRPVLALFAADDRYSSGVRPLTATAAQGKPFEVEVLALEDAIEGVPPAEPERTGATPFKGAIVAPLTTSAKGFETVQLENPEAVTTDPQGRATVTFSTPGWHRLKAGGPLNEETGEEEVVRSNRLDVCVPGPGQSACGAPPPEDEIRTPPRYIAASSDSGAQAPAGGGAGGGGGSEGPAGAGTLAAGTSGLPARIVVERLSPTLLIVKLTRPGTFVVKLAWRARGGRSERWISFKTIRARALRAGRVSIRLPKLKRGTYRVTIEAPAARPVSRTLRVHGRG
jgi:hypothetical protein